MAKPSSRSTQAANQQNPRPSSNTVPPHVSSAPTIKPDQVDTCLVAMPFFRLDFRLQIPLEWITRSSRTPPVLSGKRYTIFEDFEEHTNTTQTEAARFASERLALPYDQYTDPVEMYDRFLRQLPQEAFAVAHIKKFLELFGRALSTLKRSLTPGSVDSLCDIAINCLLFQISRWAPQMTGAEKNSLIIQFEEVLDGPEDGFPEAAAPRRIGNLDVQLRTTLAAVYFFAAGLLKQGTEARVLNGLMALRRLAGKAGWYQFPSQLRVDFALVCLQLLLCYCPITLPFRQQSGISLNTFQAMRDILVEAREALIDAEFTCEKLIIDWFVNKINQDVFVQLGALWEPSMLLRSLSAGDTGIIQDAAVHFSSYRFPVTIERIYAFIGQFQELDLMKAVIRMLMHMRYVPLSRLAELVEDSLRTTPTGQDHSCIVPLGDMTGSTSIVRYLASHSTHLKSHLYFSVREALQKTDDDVELLFADDCCLSGTQSIHTLEELLGERTLKPYHRQHVDALPVELQRRLRRRKCVFCFAVGTKLGKERLLGRASQLKVAHARVEISQNEDLEDKPFKAQSSWLWRSRQELEKCRRIFQHVGQQVLRKRALERHWPQGRREESALGYSDFQRLLVFEYNVPKTTLTALWEAGEVDGKPWLPLFPVSD